LNDAQKAEQEKEGNENPEPARQMFDEVFDEVSSDTIGIWHVTAPVAAFVLDAGVLSLVGRFDKIGSAARIKVLKAHDIKFYCLP